MAFDLKNYEEVKDRIPRFLKDHPLARIETTNMTTQFDREALTWVVRAEIWLPVNDKDLAKGWYLKSTGHAYEIDGVGGTANKTSALENCETSAIGRALANAGYGGDKRVSREEMEKVERGITPIRDWLGEAKSAETIDALRKLYNDARRASVGNNILTEIAGLAESWTDKTEK